MPGSIVRINDYDGLEWYVGDSKMEELIAFLDRIGYKEKRDADQDFIDLTRKKSLVEEGT